jgi:hypothetical protein
MRRHAAAAPLQLPPLMAAALAPRQLDAVMEWRPVERYLAVMAPRHVGQGPLAGQAPAVLPAGRMARHVAVAAGAVADRFSEPAIGITLS